MENSPLFAPALRESLKNYSFAQLRRDLLAGLTVGIVALPLSMALAIASGAPPQHGLYTTITAGILAALFGGSRFNITGPTAAFVVILLPITQAHGLGGLLIATVMSGLILMALGLGRLGQLIEFIPYPVVIGFTSGIGTVIAFLQLKDLLGLPVDQLSGHFLEKLGQLGALVPQTQAPDLFIGLMTFALILGWARLRTPIPSYLVALVGGTLLALLIQQFQFDPITIGSRFTYTLSDGTTGQGVPPVLPSFSWPWSWPNAQGETIVLSFELIQVLIGPAFAIAMLGAIESLLCSVVADGMTGTKHHSNGELVGQGIGNIIGPFFGAIPGTAAISRTATNIRSHAGSPIASAFHGVVVGVVMLLLAPTTAYIPMSALAAILIMVAWNMSEPKHFIRVLKTAPRNDVMVLLMCFSLTVLFDMVIAVAVGLMLSSLLFIQRIAELTESTALSEAEHQHPDLPPQIAIYDINGPLFFGAAHKALKVMHRVNKKITVIIVDLSDVPMIDMTGIVALESTIKQMNQEGVAVLMSGLSLPVQQKLQRAHFVEKTGKLEFFTGTDLAIARARELVIAA